MIDKMKWLYIKSLKDVEIACNYYEKQPIIGFDIETGNVKTFKGVYEPYDGDISLMQISDGKKTVVIDIFALYEEAGIGKVEIKGVTMYDYTKGFHLFSKIKTLLENPEIKVVIHNAKFEHKWLQAKCNIFVKAVFDSFLAAQLIDYNAKQEEKRKHNLAAVGRRYLGVDLDKTEQSSDWGFRPLSEDQKEYAAFDVIYAPDLR